MLLSFQNDDDSNNFAVPEISIGLFLSFGLHLEQQGHGELDMLLDSNDSRPSLQKMIDGRPYHIATTYDSFTGRKAI